MRKIFLPAISIVLAAIVFSFLCYSHPWLMTAREQSQLWLYSLDYLCSRLSEPGGLARYIGEFIVQFYYYIGWGATVTAVNGKGKVTQFKDWEQRRSEIAAEIQHYGIGKKPAVDSQTDDW